MRKKNEQSLKDVLQQLVSSYQMNGKINEAKISTAWERLMGNAISKHTKRLYVKNNKLYLTIDSAPLKQELFYAKNKIVKLLNEELGEEFIKEVVFW